MKSDIIIIGGGLLGCATAYQLSKLTDAKITLIERKDIASQATARAACLLTRSRTKLALMQMVQETYNAISELQQIFNDDLGYSQVGSITAVSSIESHSAIEQLCHVTSEFGLETQWLETDEVASKLPWINADTITKALHVPTDAYIDSALLCNAYANAAKLNGVCIRTRVGVEAILSEANKITGVMLSTKEMISAPIVINATGSWVNRLMHPRYGALGTTPVRSHFWISESKPDIFPVNQPFAILPDAKAFTRPDVGGLIIGIRESQCVSYDSSQWPSDIEDVHFSPDNGWMTLSENAALFEKYYTDIRSLGMAHYIAGPSCYTPDSMFLIGAMETAQGLYVAAGCCGGGVAMSGGIGRLMAEIVLGKECFIDKNLFNPMRFKNIDPYSENFRNQCAEARSNKKGG